MSYKVLKFSTVFMEPKTAWDERSRSNSHSRDAYMSKKIINSSI